MVEGHKQVKTSNRWMMVVVVVDMSSVVSSVDWIDVHSIGTSDIYSG